MKLTKDSQETIGWVFVMLVLMGMGYYHRWEARQIAIGYATIEVEAFADCIVEVISSSTSMEEVRTRIKSRSCAPR